MIPICLCLLFNIIVGYQGCCTSDSSIEFVKNEVVPNQQPLLFVDSNSSFTLAKPVLADDVLGIFLTEKQHLVLACPVIPIVNEKVKSEVANDSDKESSLVVNEEDFTFQWSNAQCENKVEAEVQRTKKSCARTGVIYEIGFHMKRKQDSIRSKVTNLLKTKTYDWYSVIKVCYDVKDATPIYSEHTLLASSPEIRFRLTVRPNFVDYTREFRSFSEFGDKGSYYSKESQYQNFVNIFGEEITPIYYDKQVNYIIEAQLTPADDFLYPVLQSAAFSYLNVFPGWSALVERGWRKLVKTIQEFSFKVEENLTIITGTWGLLQLKDDSEQLRNVYLNSQSKEMKVPTRVWKVVFQPSTKMAIIFIMYHNPYADSCKFEMCEDICEKYNWGIAESNDVDRGCIGCCDVRQVEGEFTNIPSIKVEGILNFIQ